MHAVGVNPKLESWCKRITAVDMPVLENTFDAISNLTTQENTSSNELARVILQDASLTARVLKLANSVYYNPSSAQIQTVSRAVVYIGFNTVRKISLSLSIIDAILSNNPRKQVLELMATSFHAAVQAREFAIANGDKDPEEVFIAALLYKLGDIAFWCIADKEGEDILNIMRTEQLPQPQAQKKILGFRFEQLTMRLTKDWRLSRLLTDTLDETKHHKNKRIHYILLAHGLAFQSTNGWNTERTECVIQVLASFLNKPVDDVRKMAYQNAIDSVNLIKEYGASSAAQYIPLPANKKLPSENIDQDDFNRRYPKHDPVLQLNILRDLSLQIENQTDINQVIEIIIEGIHRGIGMDRAVFALLNTSKNKLNAIYCLGEDSDTFLKAFHFKVGDHYRNIFSVAMNQTKALCIDDINDALYQGLFTDEIRRTLDTHQCFMAPVKIRGKTLGLIYADRAPSQRPLNKDLFNDFKHFAMQAMLNIEHCRNQ